MKQFSILGLLFFIFSSSNAQIVTTWQGPSTGGSWSDVANWNNGVPTSPTTEIIFDGSAASLSGGVITITDVTAQTNANFSFDKLTIKNAATVNLSGGGQIYWYFAVSITIEVGSRLNVGAATSSLFTVGGTLSTITNLDGILDLQGQGNSSNATSFEPCNLSFIFSGAVNIRGQLIMSGKNARFTPNASMPNFESGSVLDIKRDGGFVSKANYKNGSLIKIEGVINAAPSFTGSATYEGVIEWNSPGQLVGGSSAILLPSPTFNYIDSLVVNNTGSGSSLRLTTNPGNYYIKNIIMNNGKLEFSSPTGSGPYTEKVDTIIQNGGTLLGNAPGVSGFDNAFEPDTLNVTGKFIQNGGTFDFSNRTPNNTTGPNSSFVMQVAGDVKIGGAVKLSQATQAQNCALVFNGNSTQNFEITNTGVFSNKIKTVINNSSPVTGISAISNITLPDSLVFKKGYFFLNDFNLTNPLPVLPVANPFQTHAVTNGTGLFIQKNVSMSPVGIPIGATTTTVNPLIIGFISAGVADIGAKVDIGLIPSIGTPNTAVNRTWRLKPFAVLPANLGISFGYSNLSAGMGDGNSSFSYTANNEVGLHDGSNWQIISAPGGIAPAGANPYAISHIILNTLLAPNVTTPLVIGNVNSVTSVSNIINLQAIKNGNSALLKWDITEVTVTVSRFEIMRSADGRNFTSIGIAAVAGNQAYYSFADNSLLQGVNYYRIKMIDNNGRIKYSVIVAVINKEAGIILTALVPTIVNSQAVLFISSANTTSMQLNVTDMQGRVVKRISTTIYAGSNEVNLDCANLSAGTYQVTGYSQGEKVNMIRFIKK